MSSDFTFTVTAEEDGRMLQRVLKARYGMSRRLLRKLKANACVRVNGEAAYLTSRVTAGDRVRVILPEDRETDVVPQAMPLHIVHEDDDLLVLDKQPGVVVHPTKHYPDGTIANGLVYYWQTKGEKRSVRPVNRLDKDTSGVMVFAKHAYAHDFLAKQLQTGESVREYRAVVHGKVERDSGTINMPIAQHPDHASRRIVHPHGAHAVTHYNVLQRFPRATYIACTLETGRTHQIRVHMASIGHPVIGDAVYGDPVKNGDFPISRQALHAYTICLIHPRTGKTEHFQAEWPRDLETLLDYCRHVTTL